MKCPCGFELKFFEILKEHFDKKSDQELHGLILVDEMSTRKQLLLDKKTMKFTGVADFGNNEMENPVNQEKILLLTMGWL